MEMATNMLKIMSKLMICTAVLFKSSHAEKASGVFHAKSFRWIAHQRLATHSAREHEEEKDAHHFNSANCIAKCCSSVVYEYYELCTSAVNTCFFIYSN